jgi:hypothetical protein
VGRVRCALSKALDFEAPGGSPLALTRSAGQDVIDDFGPYGFIVAGDNDEFGFSIFGHDDADHGNIQKFRWRFELLPFEDGVEWLDCDSGHLFSRLGSSVDGIGTAGLIGVAPPYSAGESVSERFPPLGGKLRKPGNLNSFNGLCLSEKSGNAGNGNAKLLIFIHKAFPISGNAGVSKYCWKRTEGT